MGKFAAGPRFLLQETRGRDGDFICEFVEMGSVDGWMGEKMCGFAVKFFFSAL
jgi:hypothetical protein